MSAFSGPGKGRGLLIKRGTAASEVTIAGVRTKGLTVNGEAIDVTNDDDDSWRKMLDMPGEQSVEYSCAGVCKDHTLLQESLSSTDRVQSMVLLWTGGDKLQAQFYLANYKETGEYKGAVMFEATFQSQGVVTFTGG